MSYLLIKMKKRALLLLTLKLKRSLNCRRFFSSECHPCISNATVRAECCCCILPESTSIPFQHLHTIPACSPIPVCSISARAPTPCCTNHNLYIRATCIHLALGPFKENAGISLKALPLYSFSRLPEPCEGIQPLNLTTSNALSTTRQAQANSICSVGQTSCGDASVGKKYKPEFCVQLPISCTTCTMQHERPESKQHATTRPTCRAAAENELSTMSPTEMCRP